MGFSLQNVTLVISHQKFLILLVFSVIVVCVFLYDKTDHSGLIMFTLPRGNQGDRNTSSTNSRTDGKPVQFFKQTDHSGLTMSTLPRWNLGDRNTSSTNSRTDGKPVQFFKQTNHSGHTMSTLPRWNLVNRKTPPPNSRTDGKPLQFFKQVRHKPVFFLSAVVNKDRPNKGDTNVIVSAMDGARTPLTCCMIINGNQLYSTKAQIFSMISGYKDTLPKISKNIHTVHFAAKQFLCVVRGMQRVTNISLTSSRCSDDVVDYIPVIYLQPVPGGLALCAKTAHGKGPVPEIFIEWVEIQRLLGVDKILLFATDLPERLNQLFRYYQNNGILEIVNYELPGIIKGVPLRGLVPDKRLHPQYNHDETLPVLECRERLAGYTYVAGIDMDEIILPHRKETLKEFMKAHLKQYTSASAFFFHVQFHVTDWGKYAPHDNIFFFEYLRSTKPRWERYKYIYLPERTGIVGIHTAAARSGFQTIKVSPEHATIHHYRVCPHEWKSCFPPIIVDKEMLRFSHILQDRVDIVHKNLGWNDSKSTIV